MSVPRAIDWLLAQQADDGGWHSATYGALRQGAAVTSLVLYAAAHWPGAAREKHRTKLVKAWEFLRPGAEKLGCIANADGSLDYPEYSTALMLVALPRLKIEHATLPGRFTKYLVAAQLGSNRGFESANVHYGGWDLLGNGAAPGVTSGSTISLTSYVLEALATRDDSAAKAARDPALTWLTRCQNRPGDGGFYFTPDRESEANKAQWSDKAHKEPRSYGTATADGFRALVACGLKVTDARYAAALKWLMDHTGLEHVPGFDEAPPELGWREGLSFYYYARVADCFSHLPVDDQKPRREALVARVTKLQKPEGYWQNDFARMREDDRLIATCLALVALAEPKAEE